MLNDLKYLIDDSGEKTSVLVPIQIWQELNESYHKLQRKLQILNGIKDGLKEVKASKKSGKSLQTLQDFLK